MQKARILAISSCSEICRLVMQRGCCAVRILTKDENSPIDDALARVVVSPSWHAGFGEPDKQGAARAAPPALPLPVCSGESRLLAASLQGGASGLRCPALAIPTEKQDPGGDGPPPPPPAPPPPFWLRAAPEPERAQARGHACGGLLPVADGRGRRVRLRGAAPPPDLPVAAAPPVQRHHRRFVQHYLHLREENIRLQCFFFTFFIFKTRKAKPKSRKTTCL